MKRLHSALVLLSLSLALSTASTRAMAEATVQCVSNVFGKSGIVANVKWYNPADVVAEKKSNNEYNVAAKKAPVRDENIAVAQRSCHESDTRMFAVVSVVGGKYAAGSVSLAAGTLVSIAGAVACVGTAGVACPAVAVVAGIVVGGASGFGIPDPKEIFYAGAPSVLEISGTVFDAEAHELDPWNLRKHVGSICKRDESCLNFTCAYGSAGPDPEAVCCATTKKNLYAEPPYIRDAMKAGTSAGPTRCARADIATGNWGGSQRGTCQYIFGRHPAGPVGMGGTAAPRFVSASSFLDLLLRQPRALRGYARISSTQAGTASLAFPYRRSSNAPALSDGSRLISQVRTPRPRASETKPAAG